VEEGGEMANQRRNAGHIFADSQFSISGTILSSTSTYLRAKFVCVVMFR